MSAIINSVNNQLSTGRELFLGTERQQIPLQKGTDSIPRRPHTCTGSCRHSHWNQVKYLTFFYLASINCNPLPPTCLGNCSPTPSSLYSQNLYLLSNLLRCVCAFQSPSAKIKQANTYIYSSGSRPFLAIQTRKTQSHFNK